MGSVKPKHFRYFNIKNENLSSKKKFRDKFRKTAKTAENLTFAESEYIPLNTSFDCVRPNRTDVRENTSDSYFKQILAAFKQGIDGEEEKDLFITNVLKQIDGHEVESSCLRSGSQCIELLLNNCTDSIVIIRFMNAFSEAFEKVCSSPYASHILEDLLYFSLIKIKDGQVNITKTEENDASLENFSVDIVSWVHNLAIFFLENMANCLTDTYACHVLATLIQVLGGCYMGETAYCSKKSKRVKQNFCEYLGSNHNEKEAVSIEQIPKTFMKDLKKISKYFLELSDIKEFAEDNRTGLVIQTLILALQKNNPKYCKKLISVLLNSLFEDKKNSSVPLALIDKRSSYVVEKVFSVADENQQKEMWENHINVFLEPLILHPIGNCVLQRLFDVVRDKSQFETMYNDVAKNFRAVFVSRHFGIWFSIAAACYKLKAQQGQFVIDLMECLECLNPADRHVYILPLVVSLMTYSKYVEQKRAEIINNDISITLHGSLILQTLLKFHKPTKIVRSIHNVKPEMLLSLACHLQGCHVLTCFFQSVTVGLKNKDKLIQKLMSVFTAMACDYNGSLTLSRMWVLFSLKQKSLVAKHLVKHKHILQENPHGVIIIKKFGLFHFKHKFDEWKKFQQNLSTKYQLAH